MACILPSEGISYTLVSLMYANIAGIDWIEPSRITDMRCDGVIEYIYEYNSLKIQGAPNVWNIAAAPEGYGSHNPVEFTPKSQATVPYFIEVPYNG